MRILGCPRLSAVLAPLATYFCPWSCYFGTIPLGLAKQYLICLVSQMLRCPPFLARVFFFCQSSTIRVRAAPTACYILLHYRAPYLLFCTYASDQRPAFPAANPMLQTSPAANITSYKQHQLRSSQNDCSCDIAAMGSHRECTAGPRAGARGAQAAEASREGKG